MSTGCGPDIMMHSLEDFLALILLVRILFGRVRKSSKDIKISFAHIDKAMYN